MSSRVYLSLPPRGHEPPSTFRDCLNSCLSLECCRIPIHRYGKRPDVVLFAVVPLFLPPTPCPLRTAPSRFPTTICFVRRPPLIRMSAHAHKRLLVRNVMSILSHRVIARARLNEAIHWSGILRCARMMQSQVWWCTVRSMA